MTPATDPTPKPMIQLRTRCLWLRWCLLGPAGGAGVGEVAGALRFLEPAPAVLLFSARTYRCGVAVRR